MEEYWNGIDLHQHTNHDIDCTGTLVTNNYTHRDYYEWLKIQNVKLKAVTCHNNIDIAEHIKHSIIADLLGINHLVGVEVDYCFEELNFQAITILSPNVDVIKFSEILNGIRKEKGTSIYLNKIDFTKLHEETEFTFIIHAIKEKGILEQKIGELEVSTIDWVVKSLMSGMSEPIMFENTKDYHIYSVATKIEKTLKCDNIDIDVAGYVGSDYKFDDDESRKKAIAIKSKYSIFSLPTYRGLEIAIRNSETRISLNNQIINRKKYIKEIEIIDTKNFEHGIISCSPSLNVIIGESGTGKTLLLNEIYFQIKNIPLKAAQKNNKDLTNPYKKKTDGKKIINISFDEGTKIEEVKIIEIPNIYSEILKTQEDDKSIKDIFGINNVNSAGKIILDYKTNLNDYYNNIKSVNDQYVNGKKNYLNIFSALEFIISNKNDESSYRLKIELYDDTAYKKLLDQKQKADKYIVERPNTKNYFAGIKEVFDGEKKKKNVDLLIKLYDSIIDDVEIEKQKIMLKLNEQEFEIKLNSLINSKIRSSIELLGNREKTILERKEVADKELKLMINSIKSIIILELKEETYNLEFPYKKIKNELEKNSNEFARVTLNDDSFSITSADITNSHLFDMTSIKTKVLGLGIGKVNLLKSDIIKEVILKLLKIDINFSNIISDIESIPTNIEMYNSDNEEWKLLANTNKGDIAKKSMAYYFNNLIKIEQPDIILIDQPENDVDKNFITDTLSKFIKEKKIDKQIIVTSHDAIIAINSDSNKIIESKINIDNNKFVYESFDLEIVDDKIFEGTNRVAKVLDGGKKNIKKRYQIYGGELNYENRNI